MGEQQLRATPPLGVVTELQVMKSNKKYSFLWLQSSRQTATLSSHPSLQGHGRAPPLYIRCPGVHYNSWWQPRGGEHRATYGCKRLKHANKHRPPFLAVCYKTIAHLWKEIFKLLGVLARINMSTHKVGRGQKAQQRRELAFALIHKWLGLFTINNQNCQPRRRLGQRQTASLWWDCQVDESKRAF